MDNGSDHGLQDFLRDALGFPRLAPAKEERLLARVRQHQDQKASRRVIESYLARVSEIALRLRPDWLSAPDAIQEAIVVLRRLIEDPNVRYPAPLLEDEIKRHFARFGRPTR